MLPQKNISKDDKPKKKLTSIMRTKLVDKCRENLGFENKEIYDKYIKEKEPKERNNILKNIALGNVDFINKLIKIKLLSKKNSQIWFNILFERYKTTSGDEKIIYIEAIINFSDQFGTLIYSNEKKLDPNSTKKFKENLNEIIKKLEKIKDEKGIPGYIKYRIINLIEKSKNNYQKTKFEEYKIENTKRFKQEINNKKEIISRYYK